jgi:hypothetical protein
VRIGSALHDRDTTRLPWLGVKGNASRLPEVEQTKESKHFLNLLLNKRGLRTDFLAERKEEAKHM